MAPLAFSIMGLVACAFLIYVLAQFHRELARERASRRSRAHRAAIIMMPVESPAGISRVWKEQAS